MADPITVAVLQNRLNAVASEMGEAMLRTAYSQILNSSRDFSTALVDAECRLVAQADHVPVHVGAMSWAVRAVAEVFPKPARGDVYLLNDPYHGGSHLPDLTAFVPVFDGEKLIFWSVVRAHHSDIGGATAGGYNPAADEIWQEGIRVPPMRITEAGAIRPDLVDLLAINVRHQRDFRGDLSAMIGAARLGEQRLIAVVKEFGGELLRSVIDAMLDAAERHARTIVETWADGTYHGEAILDDDGHGAVDIKIRATVTIKGTDVTIDLSGSDPQVKGFVNSPHANTQSAATMAFAFLLDSDISRNEGAFRPLKVVTKQGTIVSPTEGAPVAMCTAHCGNEIVESIIVALSSACPDRVMAGWGRRLRFALSGKNPRTGRYFIWHLFHARPGGGASIAGDGWSCVGEWVSTGGIKFGSVELAEARFPLTFEHHEFRQGSGGDGKFLGGLGADLRLRVESDGPAIVTTAGDGLRHGARGMCGGEDGAPHDYKLIPPNGQPKQLHSKERGVEVPSGTIIHALSGGGGGWGNPADRDKNAEEGAAL